MSVTQTPAQVVLNIDTAVRTLLDRINGPDPQQRPKEVRLGLLSGFLNGQQFPAFQAEIQSCASLLEGDALAKDTLGKVEKILSEATTGDSCLRALNRIRSDTSRYLEIDARRTINQNTKEEFASCGIMVGEGNIEYKVIGGAKYPELEKSVVLLSPPEYNIVGDDGAITPSPSIAWQSRIVAVVVNDRTGDIEISPATGVTGRFICGNQSVDFSGKEIRINGEGRVKSAWVLSLDNPDVFTLLSGRTNIVTGRQVDYKSSIGSNPAICDAKGAQALHQPAVVNAVAA
jgi:hypothetical protein